MAQEAPDDPRYKQIPPCYCSMRVFDDAEKEMVTGSFGFLTSLYKVVDVTDGMSYALRRVERVRTNNEMVVSGLCAFYNVKGDGFECVEARSSPQHHRFAQLLPQQWRRFLRPRLLSHRDQSLRLFPQSASLSLFSLILAERPAWLCSSPRRPSLVHRHPAALRSADHPRLQSRLPHHGLPPRPHDRAKPVPDRQCRRDGHSRAAQHQPRSPSQGSLSARLSARRARLSRRSARHQDAGRALQREVREGRAAAAFRAVARVRRVRAVHCADREDAEQLALDVRHVLQRSRRCEEGR